MLALRIAVPLELRRFVGCREIVRSLRTADRQAAIPQALELAATVKRLFYEIRTSMSQSDDEKIRAIVQRAKHKLELNDLRERHEAEIIAQRHQVTHEIKAARLEAENEALKRVLGDFLKSGMPTPVQPQENAPKLQETALPDEKESLLLHRLAEVIPFWKKLKKPAVSTVDIYEGAVRHFESIFPEINVEKIEKRHIREFIERRQVAGATAKTIEKEHGAIRALLTIAIDQEWVATNVASGVILPKIEESKIRGYRVDELQAIFNSPVFTKGERPVAGKGEAAFWMPLLMAFTGARRDEVAQLTTDSVRHADGVAYILIDAIDEGRLKTEESKRAVPLHRRLIEMGFMSLVAERVKAGGGQLFPHLKPNKRGQYGAKWGDWWGRYVRNKVGITDLRINPAHSFRHAFITECRRVEMREDFERALVGHVRGSAKKDAHDGYGEHLVSALKVAIDRIEYRGLELPK